MNEVVIRCFAYDPFEHENSKQGECWSWLTLPP